MSTFYEAAALAQTSLPTAAWDLKSFLENATSYVQSAGGLLLMLVGTAGLVWGGVLCVKRLMGSQSGNQQGSWGTILALILVGGAIATGGWTLMDRIGGGGEQTITELGGGAIVQVHQPDN